MLRMSADHHLRMVAHCIGGLPEEACGLLAGPAGAGAVTACYLTTNAARSARVYEVDPREHLRADRDADRRGLEIIGVFHSHTHTDAYPSPTDIAQAPDPGWHYVIVSLRDSRPAVRSYLIVDGLVLEESLVISPYHGAAGAEPDGDQPGDPEGTVDGDQPGDPEGTVGSGEPPEGSEVGSHGMAEPGTPRHARAPIDSLDHPDSLAS